MPTLTAIFYNDKVTKVECHQTGKDWICSRVRKTRPLSHKAIKAEAILQSFRISDADVRKVMLLFEDNINAGLSKEKNDDAVVKMFPSYVRSIPDSTESGRFLALDLGGTNFRVLLVNLFKGEEPEILSEIYSIPESIMKGSGDDLFDKIAESISDFLGSKRIEAVESEPIPLGFTFSFPCRQRGLNVGILEMWTKGFSCSGVEGHNVVELLEKSIARRGGLHVKCLAVLNDTVGTLLSCAYEDQRCQVGLILGTGTNACYMEQLEHVQLWDSDMDEPRQVIINTEWGAFGSDGCLDFLRTDLDVHVDEQSMNPSKQTYEKMISGMYLGELARLLLVRLVKAGCLFGGRLSRELDAEDAFLTKHISQVESDAEGEYGSTRRVLQALCVSDASDEDCTLVRLVCEAVSRRAAVLASAGLAVLLNRINKADVTIGVDGSLFKYHGRFRHIMTEKIQQLINPGIEFRLLESHDGSGKGAALVAAVAQRVQQPTNSALKQLVENVIQ